jgi:hypothetical protein
MRSISTIGKPGISFIRYPQYQRLESLEYPSSGTLNINDWKAWNILHQVSSISTIGKPEISFIRYAQYQRLESLEYPSSGTLNINDWKA